MISREDLGKGPGDFRRLVAYDLASGKLIPQAWRGAGGNAATILHIDQDKGEYLLERDAVSQDTEAWGLPEVVRDNETGFLCPVGDIDGMSTSALGILRDRDRWNAMSTLAAQDARERFSLDAIVGEYEAFYEYALSLPSSTQRGDGQTPGPKTT